MFVVALDLWVSLRRCRVSRHWPFQLKSQIVAPTRFQLDGQRYKKKICIYIYIYIFGVYIMCIYIYIERERELAREREIHIEA